MTDDQFKAFKANLSEDDAFMLEESACIMEEANHWTREVACEKAVEWFKALKKTGVTVSCIK